MTFFRCKKLILATILSLTLAGLLPAAFAAAETPAVPASGFHVQLIADQTTAVPSGLITYHILYHNETKRDLDQAEITVAVGGKAAVQDNGGGTWDATSGTLQWKLRNIGANGAGVIQFSLRANSDSAAGDAIELKAAATADGGAVIGIPPVRVIIGTDIHQPAFNGYPDGGFHPQGNLTRAETAAIVSRLEQLSELGSGNSYTDVPSSHWAYAYIEKVTKAGWMQGDGSRFNPDTPITRAELAVILLRIRGIQPLPLSGFADTVSNWAADSIGTAKALGYISGDASGGFHGESPIAREEAAKLLDISLSRGELTDGAEKVAQHWPDVPRTSWSFGWVEELSLVAHESAAQGGMKEALVRYWPEKTQPF